MEIMNLMNERYNKVNGTELMQLGEKYMKLVLILLEEIWGNWFYNFSR
jgi:hypothetical protein